MTSAETDLSVRVEAGTGPVVVVPSGKICFDNLAPLRAAFDKALAASPPKLVVDLGGVSMCDSSGLQLLVGVHEDATRAAGWVRLVAPQPLVQRVLVITQLIRMFEVYDSVDEATAD